VLRFEIFDTKFPQLSSNTTAFKWLNTPKLREHIILWNITTPPHTCAQ